MISKNDALIIAALAFMRQAVQYLEAVQPAEPRVPLAGPFPFEVIS